MLVIEIEYLTGVSYSAELHDPSRTEWPPHPDRVFLALISSWGRFRDESEADSLRWLESQKPPEVLFPNGNRRTRFFSFVPTSGNSEKKIFPEREKTIPILNLNASIIRKKRMFPSVVLPDDDRTVCLVWPDAEPAQGMLSSLTNVANRISYIGHSASLVRVTVASNNNSESANRYITSSNGQYFLRCPHKGRFNELTSEFDTISNQGMRFQWRPHTAPTCKYQKHGEDVIQSPMGSEWTVLSCQGGFVPILETFPVVAKRMRDAIMAHIRGPIHETISGHNIDGTVLQKPHMAIAPMANIGWKKHSNASLLGIAIILPRRSSYGTEERAQLKQAIAKFLNTDGHYKQDHTLNAPDIGVLEFGPFGKLYLKRHDDSRSSLLPDRYVRSSNTWTSATPIILDQYPKKNKSPEEIIAKSCTNMGLPKPVSVTTSRYSEILGAPAAYTASKSNKGWLSPKPGLFAERFVCHATISFHVKISGPVIVGAGRYYGMGLCLPHHPE